MLPRPDRADEHGLAGVGADLEPTTLIAAYRAGLFPMPLGRLGRRLGWWSPDPRGIIPVNGLHVSRTLARRMGRFEVRVDTRFRDVMEACGDPGRSHGWIDAPFVDAYTRLHELGWASSVEVYEPGTDRLVGGLYGVRIGGFFAGESMFHHVTDASKVAMVAAVELMRQAEVKLFDVQWTTPHLASMGAVDISRQNYLGLLRAVV